MRLLLAGLLLASWFSVVRAEPLPSPGTIGLLELASLFGGSLCGLATPDTVPVYADPDSAKPVGELRLEPARLDSTGCDREVRIYRSRSSTSRILVTEEVGYEKPGVVVVERQHDWFRILLASQFAWVKPAQAYRFHSLQELYQTQLTYLSTAWDGRFCSRPGQFLQCVMVSTDPEPAPAVRIVESRTFEGQSWLKVRVLSRSSCGEGEEFMPPSEGWVPAYGLEGKPTVWFSSRSC